MNDIIRKNNIKDMIYEIRGKQVMLDSDLAKLYQCKNGTKEINQAVKNNIDKFPERFSWKLTEEDSKNLLVKNFDQKETRGGRYKNPRVFTEQGVAMLATILKSPVATKVSISIMDAFVEMRKFINNNRDIFKRVISIENDLKLLKDKQVFNDEKFEMLFKKFDKQEIKEKILYDGEIYDAYSLLINIIREAKKKIIIIDNYIDKTIFDILSYKDENIKVEIWTNTLKSKLDYDKFNLQYENVEIKKVNNIHDRFIIIDDNKLYHVGASLKDLGKKCFAVNKMNKENIHYLMKKYNGNI